MQPAPLTKYAFRIKTRVGLVLDHLMIPGRDLGEAERKLRQIYPRCEILGCVCHHGSVRVPVGQAAVMASA